jgi:hypothetical protein
MHGIALFMLFPGALSAFASIDSAADTRPDEFAIVSNATKFSDPDSIARNTGSRFSVKPIYLDRGLSVLTGFSRLPEDFRLTLERFQAGGRVAPRTRIHAGGTRIENSERRRHEHAWVDIRHRVPLSSRSTLETYLETSQAETEFAFAVGARGHASFRKMEINGELSYEELMASSVASPAVKAALSGSYRFDSLQSTVELGWRYADENPVRDLDVYRSAAYTPGSIYAPDFSNISILNVSMACRPAHNMFMSVDYFHYVQDQLQAQSFSRGFWQEQRYTNGESRDLGQELDIKATYTYSDSWKSEWFAGWFAPGEAYANTDDTKTFEIRGEIVVNF